jgi:hypothetical protein
MNSGFVVIPGNHTTPGCRVPIFQLLQWKYAMKLEAIGMKHSSGRSVRKHACGVLGLKPNTPTISVIKHIDHILGLDKEAPKCEHS